MTTGLLQVRQCATGLLLLVATIGISGCCCNRNQTCPQDCYGYSYPSHGYYPHGPGNGTTTSGGAGVYSGAPATNGAPAPMQKMYDPAGKPTETAPSPEGSPPIPPPPPPG